MAKKCTTKCDARAKLLFGLIKPIVFIFLTFSLPSCRWILGPVYMEQKIPLEDKDKKTDILVKAIA